MGWRQKSEGQKVSRTATLAEIRREEERASWRCLTESDRPREGGMLRTPEPKPTHPLGLPTGHSGWSL